MLRWAGKCSQVSRSLYLKLLSRPNCCRLEANDCLNHSNNCFQCVVDHLLTPCSFDVLTLKVGQVLVSSWLKLKGSWLIFNKKFFISRLIHALRTTCSRNYITQSSSCFLAILRDAIITSFCLNLSDGAGLFSRQEYTGQPPGSSIHRSTN